MNNTITLEQAMEAWGQWKTANSRLEKHVPPGELYEFLIHPLEIGGRERILQHLRECPECLRELRELGRCRKEAGENAPELAIALPKAAASAQTGPRRITAEEGKYTIEIRPHLADQSRGLVIVKVAAGDPTLLEGKILTLVTGQDKVILKKKVVGGEVVQEVADLGEIEYPFIIIIQ
jgi:hypothetical protein